MKRLWLYFALSSAALVLGAILSLFYRDWVREQVVIPVAFLFWVLSLLYRSIPQIYLWGILVIIVLVIAVSASRPAAASQITWRPEKPGVSVSRYTTWLRYTTTMNNSQFANDNFARELIRLIIQILSYQHGLAADEVYKQLDQNDLGLSPELYAFIKRRGFQEQPKPEPRWRELYYRLVPRNLSPVLKTEFTPLEIEANQIITQIEHLISQVDTNTTDQNSLEAAP
jgi:hypothetical protein